MGRVNSAKRFLWVALTKAKRFLWVALTQQNAFYESVLGSIN
ncbi:hypothetical protein [Leptospira noguchii]|nr:hypothetical protein [Leptospira noguchii]